MGPLAENAVTEPFRKDLSHLAWAEVYERQAARGHLVDAWMEALHLGPGGRVLEIGAGPGYVSLALADRVGPGGLVSAVDRSAEALAFLERLRTQRGLSQIQPILGDAATLEPLAVTPDSALVTMVLHHAEDPPAILRNLARLLPLDARAVIAEFHPEGPCAQGPPKAHRIEPARLRGWCEEAGLEVLEYRRQSREHYMLVIRRTA
jgi:ubiquinone/menaquinone biosynthesis C-methylase UbiE